MTITLILFKKVIKFLNKLGPGLLFAGGAIGVSHLVQSTRAGADFGFGLLWALLLINLIKYPFFQYGPRYVAATGENLLEGYKRLGKIFLKIYGLLTLATMFTIQTAVTIVTAGIVSSLFGGSLSLKSWTVIILIICFLILIFGKYRLLDKMIKFIVFALSISTIFAVIASFYNFENTISWIQIFPDSYENIVFLIAFMGWMPAPLDVSIWHSLWAQEKNKITNLNYKKSTILDFNIGYFGTVVLGVAFLSLGSLVMFDSGEQFSNSGDIFSLQLIKLYTKNLGESSNLIITIAVLTTMLSTTLATLDASPRAINKTFELLIDKRIKFGYTAWLVTLVIGTIAIFYCFLSEMGSLVKIATILSFLTTPIYAIMNYSLICSKHTPKKWQPSKLMHFLSVTGIIFLIGFNIWYLTINKFFIY